MNIYKKYNMNKFFLVFLLLIVAHNTTIKAQDNDGTLKMPKNNTPAKHTKTTTKTTNTKSNINWKSKYSYAYKEGNYYRVGISKLEIEGYTDLKGKIIIPVKYNFMCAKMDKVKFVLPYKLPNGKIGFVNQNGIELNCQFLYEESECEVNGYIRVKRNGKWGYIDLNGKETVPCEYDELGFNRYNNSIMAVKNKKMGVITINNEIRIPLVFYTMFGSTLYGNTYDIDKYLEIEVETADMSQYPILKNIKKFYVNNKGECVKDCP